MDAWKLPDVLEVSGIKYKIRTEYSVILDILKAMNDPDIFEPDMTEEEKQWEKILTMLQILYIDFENIPFEDYKEAAEKASEFIDMGIKNDGRPTPRMMDWDQDAPIVIPAINKVLGKEIRSPLGSIHWWTFLGAYMEIRECLFSDVLGIRHKKIKGKKLEKWEQEFYLSNKNLIDLKTKKIERSQEERDELRELFGIKK